MRLDSLDSLGAAIKIVVAGAILLGILIGVGIILLVWWMLK